MGPGGGRCGLAAVTGNGKSGRDERRGGKINRGRGDGMKMATGNENGREEEVASEKLHIAGLSCCNCMRVIVWSAVQGLCVRAAGRGTRALGKDMGVSERGAGGGSIALPRPTLEGSKCVSVRVRLGVRILEGVCT